MSDAMWYYLVNGQQTGPVTEAQITQMVHAQQLATSTMVWSERLADWQPFHQVFPGHGVQASYSPPPAAMATPAYSAPSPVHDLTRHMSFVGLFMIIVGGIYCLTIIGALVGVPFIFCGLRFREAAEGFSNHERRGDQAFLMQALNAQKSAFFILKVLIIIGLVFFVLYLLFLLVTLVFIAMN